MEFDLWSIVKHFIIIKSYRQIYTRKVGKSQKNKSNKQMKNDMRIDKNIKIKCKWVFSSYMMVLTRKSKEGMKLLLFFSLRKNCEGTGVRNSP